MTSGGRWPDGSPVAAADALIVSYEDDPADTIVPRLSAMGADLSRIHILRSVRDGKEQRAFNVQRDLEPLLKAAARIQTLKLVIVDPIVSAIGPVDSHRNLETRQALQPLADFAAASGAVVLGITHLAKGTSGRDPLERLLGSIAFGALARVVLGAAKVRDDNGTERRVIARIKSNIGPDDGGYNYEMVPTEVDGIQTVTVLWGSPLDGTARELLAAADEDEPAGDRSALAEAADFLSSVLEGGPMSARDVYRHANDAGIAKRTLHRAKREVGIKPSKTRFDGGWEWKLPVAAADSNNAKVAKGATLRSLDTLATLATNGVCPHCGDSGGGGCAWCSPPDDAS
jgi:putative DNA primase/helicase